MYGVDQPHLRPHVSDVGGDLERGRDCYGRRAWAEAYAALTLADQAAPLAAEDLELLAMSAYLVGRDDEYLGALDRAYNAFLSAGEDLRAVRCAFWLGLRLSFRGETGRATGWLGRAHRLLEREARDCVEHGYLLLPVVNQQIAAGNGDAAYAAAARAAAIGDRFGERDLSASARHLQGRVLLEQGRIAEGLALLDEAMLAVSAGDLSPLVAGLAYCNVIEGCQQVHALDRAREWTSALTRWCEDHPEMVAFTGVCLVHRAEIMQLGGAWTEAIDEARRACERCVRVANQQAAAAALYQQAEVHRLRGEFTAAEEAYRSASQWGWEPQPGLALLRIAQGRTDAATAAMRRVVGATTDRLQRVRLLPAHVEIMLAAGAIEEARGACRDLEEIAASFATDVLGAMAAHARGAVELAEGDAKAAIGSLRRAWTVWQQVEAPYVAARVRVLIGLACRVLDDNEGGRLELDAARAVFEQLGAAPDLNRLDALARGAPADHPHGLTRRELQVLRLVTAGKTNKAIAAELHLSEKTIDRHVSNIFTKLDVPSRAAATAYAYEHKLV
jgi:DNA-binding CsgD family transcriptional regulator/tetratricopeptide (TPR) repeat protein